jgi:release factor glutamine methyltransferase
MNGLLREEEFMGLSFQVNDQVLNPRPETELLVETGLWILRKGEPPKHFGEPPKLPSLSLIPPRSLKGKGENVLDIGTGSGCIAVSMSIFAPSAQVTATDVSPEALEVAQENARRHHVSDRIDFREGDLFEAVDNLKFDLILSNLPYIAADEWGGLPPEVRREPKVALWGGLDGLETVGRLIDSAPLHLENQGWLALEIGFKQAAAVRNQLAQAGFSEIAVLKDFSGIDRIVAGRI